MNKDDDVLGISSSVDAINCCFGRWSKNGWSCGSYGTGKSSLTEMLIKQKPKKKKLGLICGRHLIIKVTTKIMTR